jgi:hypothetical protein
VIAIPLGNGGVTLIDECDEALTRHSWKRAPRGYAYRYSSPTRPVILLHREILGLLESSMQVDHIDRDGLNNRRSNLRVVTHAENMQNRVSHGGSSRYRGVSWDRTVRRWKAQAMIAKKQHNLGHFESERDAAIAAATFRAAHMPFARPDPALAS